MRQIPTLIVVSFLLLTFTAFNSLPVIGQTNPDKPNILLIISDDIGIDYTNGYQEEGLRPTTPTLDSLRTVGLTFTNAWSNPMCTPTRAAMMSGKYGVKTGVISVPGNLELSHTSIFKELGDRTENAYADAVIGKWHISSPVDLDHPAQHDVDYYEGFFRGAVADYYVWDKVTNSSTSNETAYVTSDLTNTSINWVNNQNKPWFLWLAHAAGHSPFQTPPDDLYSISPTNNNQQRYVASIEAMDAEIGRLLKEMTPAVLENTVVIYIGDNGSPRQVIQNYPNGHNKGTLYQGGVHVPMIVAGKGVARKNETEAAMVNVVDIYATVLEIAGAELQGGIYNSFSFDHLLSSSAGAKRPFNYTDVSSNSTTGWTIRDPQYKLIEFSDGSQEFYDLIVDPLETNNLNNNLSPEQVDRKTILRQEGMQIRSDWSCQDLILNGSETSIDDCTVVAPPTANCDNDNTISTTNIGCCDTPSFPNAFFETVAGDTRVLYSNNYPNHSFCYNPARVPEPQYYKFEIPANPVKAAATTSVTTDNFRPARYFGVATNGILFIPNPAQPFIFENTQTGEYNWDWVFEPTNTQGAARDLVSLDCSSAHTGGQGYHYHGNMFEFVEERIEAGISTTTNVPEAPIHIGWASDGFPMLYRFGPDANGNMKRLVPSYQLREGERPGNGITAPCGAYNGRYINDYTYLEGAGDLDECNGIEQMISINTSRGLETFSYFYVVTDEFPQISRCMVGTPDPSFENNNRGIANPIDNDQDGFIAAIDCNDNDAAIHPNAAEIADNDIDENCDGMADMTTSMAICTSPSQFTTKPIDNRRVQLAWEDVNNADRYKLQLRFKGSTNWVIDATISRTIVNVRGPLNTYKYRVRTICQDGEGSDFSAIQEFTITGNFVSATTRNSDSVPELIIPAQELVLFPNPVRGLLKLEQPIYRGAAITIYSSSGEIVLEHTIKKIVGITTIPVGQLASGVYFLSIQEKGKQPLTRKFVKE